MTDVSAQGHLGERKLTTVHAIGQSLAIGPMFSAGALTGLVASASGFSTPLSVLLGMIGAVCLGYVVSLFARRFSGAGAVYEYLVHGAHPGVGVFGAGIYGVGVLFLGGGGVYIANGFLTQAFLADIHIHVAWWIPSLVILAVAVSLNHIGVRVAIEGVLALAGISMIPFLILAIAIIAKGGVDGNTLSVFTTSHSSINGVFHGILFAVTLFIGFEAAASIGEEAREPHKAIPRALIGSVLIAGVFFLLVTYAGSIGFGPKGAMTAWPTDPSPMGSLAQQYVGHWLSVLIDLVVALDSISVALAFTVTGSRVFFALGRDGLLPKWTTTTTPRQTPLGGNMIILGAGIVAIVLAGVTTLGNAIGYPNDIEAFQISAGVGSFLIEGVYVMLALAAFRIIWTSFEGGGRVWRLIVAVLAVATPVLAYYGSLNPFPAYPGDLSIIITGICAVAVLIWFLLLRSRHPDRIRNAAQNADQHHGVAPLDETLDGTPADGLAL
jgi:amino acid transporter